MTIDEDLQRLRRLAMDGLERARTSLALADFQPAEDYFSAMKKKTGDNNIDQYYGSYSAFIGTTPEEYILLKCNVHINTARRYFNVAAVAKNSNGNLSKEENLKGAKNHLIAAGLDWRPYKIDRALNTQAGFEEAVSATHRRCANVFYERLTNPNADINANLSAMRMAFRASGDSAFKCSVITAAALVERLSNRNEYMPLCK